MIRLKALAASTALAAALLTSTGAFADDCVNFSRPAPPANADSCTLQGNWLYLGCMGFPHWGFVTPGTDLSSIGIPLTQPGAHGIYTNGKVDDLLGLSAICDPSKGVVFKRQNGAILTGDSLRGVWSGCGA